MSAVLLSSLAAATAAPTAAAPAASHDRLDRFPRLVVWAWERSEDLRFLPPDVGVAFLGATVRLQGDVVEVVWRRQPLQAGPRTPLMAVVRVESVRNRRPVLSIAQRERIVHTALALSRLPRVVGVQVDSDAALSERPFFEGLLGELRRRLDPGLGLSFTALASWCLGDPWLERLPIDEAVPMLFDLGPDARSIRSRLEGGGDLVAGPCRVGLGLSLKEPLATFPRGRRLYLFSPVGWTRESFDAARKGLEP